MKVGAESSQWPGHQFGGFLRNLATAAKISAKLPERHPVKGAQASPLQCWHGCLPRPRAFKGIPHPLKAAAPASPPPAAPAAVLSGRNVVREELRVMGSFTASPLRTSALQALFSISLRAKISLEALVSTSSATTT
jgi:hypothetical protein